MKTKTLAMLVGLTALTAFKGIAQEQPKEEDNSYAVIDNTVVNKNVLQGLHLGDDPMNQLYAEFGNDIIEFGTWSNYNLKNNNIEEIDLIVKKTFGFDISENSNLSLTAGAMYYTYPNTPFKDAQDLFAEAKLTGGSFDYRLDARKVFGPESYDGFILKGSVSKDIQLTDNISLTPSATVTYNNHFFTDVAGFSSGHVELGASYFFDENTLITAKAMTQKRLSDDFSDYVRNESMYSLGITKIF